MMQERFTYRRVSFFLEKLDEIEMEPKLLLALCFIFGDVYDF